MVAAARLGGWPRGLRADRARRGLRRRRDPHEGRAARRRVGGRRLEDLHHERGHRDLRVRHHHRAHGRGRDLEPDRPERHSRLRDLCAAAQARLARVGHARALLPLVRRAGGKPSRRARTRLPSVHGDPRRRPHFGRGDGCRAGAGRIRPRHRLREGAAAVRAGDRAFPGDPVPACRHGDGDRGRATARLPRGVAQG